MCLLVYSADLAISPISNNAWLVSLIGVDDNDYDDDILFLLSITICGLVDFGPWLDLLMKIRHAA